MKKTIALLYCLMMTIPVWAQTLPDSSITDLVNQTQKEETEQPEWIGKMNQMMSQSKNFTDEQLIEMVLQIPFEYRQYVVPQYHESRYIPQKVRTHPDIIIWKGKKPTRIAPQLKEWAAQHLDYLPAKLYPALMPEMWPDPTLETKPRTDNVPLMSGHYKTSTTNPNSVLNKLGTPRFTTTGGALVAEDIERLDTTVKALNAFYAKQPNNNKFLAALYSTADATLPTSVRTAFPFRSLAQRLEKMGYGAELNQLLQEQGWQDTNDFTNRADRLVKAYRANNLHPMIAIEVYKMRQKYPTYPEKPLEQLQWMYARMYESSPEDINFAGQHLKELRQLLKHRKPIMAGAIVYID